MSDSLMTTHNGDVPWNSFDSEDYFRRNYRVLLPEDRQVLRIAASFLAEHFRGSSAVDRAIDVGAGTNLYPALLMLPWAAEIALLDVAESNVTWLSENVSQPPVPWPWQAYWDEISRFPGYQDIAQPEQVLAVRSTVEQRNIFDLDRAAWGLGSMFFVADGMTSVAEEFVEGVRSFVRALRPGAPFVATFMEKSAGYVVGGQDFPAVSVDRNSLNELFGTLSVEGFDIQETDRTNEVVRSGYEGMLVVTGLAS
jgi:NNMT/PNMT/TEMT family